MAERTIRRGNSNRTSALGTLFRVLAVASFRIHNAAFPGESRWTFGMRTRNSPPQKAPSELQQEQSARLRAMRITARYGHRTRETHSGVRERFIYRRLEAHREIEGTEFQHARVSVATSVHAASGRRRAVSRLIAPRPRATRRAPRRPKARRRAPGRCP